MPHSTGVLHPHRFVHKAVTVVIEPVAELGRLRPDTLGAAIFASATERLILIVPVTFTLADGAHAVLACGLTVIDLWARIATGAAIVDICLKVKGLVYQPVTIIIEGIAKLLAAGCDYAVGFASIAALSVVIDKSRITA